MFAAMGKHLLKIEAAVRQVKKHEEYLLPVQSNMLQDRQSSIHDLRTIVTCLKQTENIAVEANKRSKILACPSRKEMRWRA
eukprot:3214545-Ditylum_brightwellii.AAC.1